MSEPTGVLFVDDEPENIGILVDILSDALDERVDAAHTVHDAVQALLAHDYRLVVMDVFIPLGDHEQRDLGPRAASVQQHAEHLGGLALLEEIDRLDPRPQVLAHTACTDRILLDIFKDRVLHRIPKPAPVDTVLRDVMDVLRG